ncbi:MAG: DUF3853 family protein [Bacteroidales bacterium]|nr:DUF3853 family protein [Bacteroidales bacterium]MBR5015043.1 DUF3853 family protein [Bacteroidales bacterium]
MRLSNEVSHFRKKSKGSALTKEDLQAKYPEVVRHIKKGKNSIREIAKLTGVSVSTIQRVKASIE